MHRFRVLSDRAFSSIERKFQQLEERMNKTEERLKRLETNVKDTTSDVSKLALIESKMRIFNTIMSFSDRSICLGLNEDHIDLVIPSFDQTGQSKLVVVHLHEPIEKIERRLNNQIQAIPFYHYFFVESRFDHFLEFSIERSDLFLARVRIASDRYDNDEINVELLKGNNIRVSYIRALNVDARQKLVFDENSSVRFELSILDIVDDYDEYRIRAIASEECRLSDFENAVDRLRAEIELNEQLERFSRQSEM